MMCIYAKDIYLPQNSFDVEDKKFREEAHSRKKKISVSHRMSLVEACSVGFETFKSKTFFLT